ncbi:MAG TPA: ABC transporter permease subunit/CPBP intramembrane protease [Longimicrobiaceae bacterium]|nr:ABC transporter permease subunit/CPBP intramembrane protease [Longimicrobiaceae bacterium]
MNWRVVRSVLGKELRETLRDRRTLMMMVVFPIFLYPVLFVLMQQLALFGQKSLESEPVRVVVSGSPEAAAFLARDTALRVVAASVPAERAVGAGEAEAAVVLAPAPEGGTGAALVLYDGSSDRSQYARDLVGDRLDAWSDTVLARRLAARGLPASFARPLAVADSSVATARQVGGYTLGRILPLVLILMTVLGAFYPAIDLAAGEKERGTLETLLTAPVPAREIVAGKFAAVAIIGFSAAALNLGSMLLTFQSGVFSLQAAGMGEFSIPASAVLVILAMLFPLAVLFSALFLGIAVRSQSFKEAQNALTPVYIVSFLPAVLATVPGISFTPAVAVVPVAGVAFLFRGLLQGDAPLLPSALALASTAVYALLALRFAARNFGREEVLFGTGSGTASTAGMAERVRAWRAAGRGIPLPAESLAFVAGVGLLYFYLGGALQAKLLERGLLVSEWLLLALPAVAFAALGPYDARRTLALRAPSARGLAAGLLVILGGLPLGWGIGWVQTFFLPFPREFMLALEKLLTAGDAGRMIWLLLLVALTPAVCEELVFRGVLLQGLGREMRMWRAVGLSALVFGAFHLSFETAVRFVPTAWIGLLIGYVVWHTRSLFAGMLMHFVNNGLAVLIVSTPSLRGALFTPEGEPPWLLVAASPVLLAAGVLLLPKRPSDPLDAPPPDRAPAGEAEPAAAAPQR